MKVKIEQANEVARSQESLKGVVIDDLHDTQVKAVDALILAEHGIVIPEQNIFYDDKDIAYGPDFDDVEWSEQPINLIWNEKLELAQQLQGVRENEVKISLKIKISDGDVRRWVYQNYEKMSEILENFVVDIYKVNKIIKK